MLNLYLGRSEQIQLLSEYVKETIFNDDGSTVEAETIEKILTAMTMDWWPKIIIL